MSDATLNGLLQLVKEIADVDLTEKLEEAGGTRTMWRWQYQGIEALFERKRATYVDSLLAKTQDKTMLIIQVSEELDAIERNSGEDMLSSVEYLRKHLLPYLKRQASMPAIVRSAIKIFDKIFLFLAFAIIFGGLFYGILSRLHIFR